MVNENYYITIYESESDKTLYFEELKPNSNGEPVANFKEGCCGAATFDSLADAQCFCKVLLSKYVKRLTLHRMQDINDSNRQNLEVCLRQYDGRTAAEPFGIWGVSCLNNNEVFVV